MRGTSLGAILLLLALVPLADAQTPAQPQPCGPLVVGEPVAPVTVEKGHVGTVSLNVKNTGNRAVDVTVAASTTSAGWTLTTPDSVTKNLASAADGTFEFSLQPGPNATGDATLNFATTGACPAPAPIGTCGPASQQLCSVQGAAKTASIGLAKPGGFRIPGLDDLNIPVPYLIGGVVLVGLAVAVPLVLRKRAPHVATASCPEPLKHVRAGKGASFPIELRNPVDEARKLHLEVGAVPEGWSAFLPLPEIQLAPKEARSLWLMVRAPPDAAVGTVADVEIVARDAARPEPPTRFKVRAEVLAEGAPNE